MTYDVFLSYARSELSDTVLIREKLQSLGLKIFFDTEGIEGGDEFPDIINSAIKQSGAVLSLWSPAALERPWVRRECRVGQMRGVLVPVMVKRFEPLDVPAEFVGVQHIDLTDFTGDKHHPGFVMMLRALGRALRRDDLVDLANSEPVLATTQEWEDGERASPFNDWAAETTPSVRDVVVTWAPYEALGVDPLASADDIRNAYRRIAREYHPDIRPNDPAAADKFRRATAAFNFLSDATQRARFDRGEIDANGNETHTLSRETAKQDRPGNLGGFLRPRKRGADIRFTLDIDLVDAISGAKRRVSFAEGKTVDVNIPAGVESGQVLRLDGQGGLGRNGGERGDIFARIVVRDHPVFKRVGKDIHLDFPISLAEAVTGGRVQVPTPHGAVAVLIPLGANTGQRLRLRGKGVLGGDMLIRLLITLPERNNADLAPLIAKWTARDTPPPRPSA